MPDPPDGDKSNRPGRTRLDTLDRHGVEPGVPETAARYLSDYLFQAGPAMPGFDGPEPLTSTELRAWEDGEGVRLSPWEFRLIRELSRAYVNETRAARRRAHPAPWRPEDFHIADQLDAADRLEEAMDRTIDL